MCWVKSVVSANHSDITVGWCSYHCRRMEWRWYLDPEVWRGMLHAQTRTRNVAYANSVQAGSAATAAESRKVALPNMPTSFPASTSCPSLLKRPVSGANRHSAWYRTSVVASLLSHTSRVRPCSCVSGCQSQYSVATPSVCWRPFSVDYSNCEPSNSNWKPIKYPILRRPLPHWTLNSILLTCDWLYFIRLNCQLYHGFDNNNNNNNNNNTKIYNAHIVKH